MTDISTADRPPLPRVLLLLASLNSTGEERTAINLLKNCDPTRLTVSLGLLHRHGPFLSEVEPELITGPTVWPGWLASRLVAPFTVIGIIRKTKPDVLMSFGMGIHVYTWLALAAMGPRRPIWVCREDNNPDAEIRRVIPTQAARDLFFIVRRQTYKAADAIVAIAEDLKARLARAYLPAESKTRVIYNPIEIAKVIARSREPAPPTSRPYVVAAGRLVTQKGFDGLIRAFAASTAARDLDLIILGEGPLKGQLEALAKELGVADRVKFPGFQDNPWAWFSRARVFVLSSLWEGFGNVVAEALACGAPTIVTDCDFGPREQITDGVDGLIVPVGDDAPLTRALDKLLTDPVLCERLVAAGRDRAWQFDLPRVVEAYNQFFEEMAGARR